eukprot:TRINITY_DN13364_c0_g4_i2.p1 TRINITY_DN13364_c0_g4~~TRINITY_DN13364_c0_g4_i2.p1  ORF type:complete len:889 (-),score=76.90 TRINITY_DN13364_c0_g4_i2:66-2732(-)
MEAVELQEVSIPVSDKGQAGRLVGRGGRTRLRISKATGCDCNLSTRQDSMVLVGTEEQTRLAAIVVKCIQTQQGHDINVEPEEITLDCTTLKVPKRTTKMVLGKAGDHLHSIEDEASTIMFFGRVNGDAPDPQTNTLIIFGHRKGRRLSQLLVMGLVESIIPGTYTDAWYKHREVFDEKSEVEEDDDWGTTVLEFDNDIDLGYVIGKNAATRMKLMRTSGCVICRVGLLLFISGSEEQRTRATEYMNWLINGRDRLVGYVGCDNPHSRNDCTLITVPDVCAGYVTGHKRNTLNDMEARNGVLIFAMTEKPAQDAQTFGIFGPLRGRSGAELQIRNLIETQKEGHYDGELEERISERDDYVIDYVHYTQELAAYICGKERMTLKKLMGASGAVMEFIGRVCGVAGERDERRRCHQYIDWHVGASTKDYPYIDSKRDDVLEVKLPRQQLIDALSGAARNIEIDTECIFLSGKNASGDSCLFICSHHGKRTKGDKGCAKADVLLSQALANGLSADRASHRDYGSDRRDSDYGRGRDDRGDHRWDDRRHHGDDRDRNEKRHHGDGQGWNEKRHQGDARDWNDRRHQGDGRDWNDRRHPGDNRDWNDKRQQGDRDWNDQNHRSDGRDWRDGRGEDRSDRWGSSRQHGERHDRSNGWSSSSRQHDERQDRSNGWPSSSRQHDERQDRSNGRASSSRQPDERQDRSNGWSSSSRQPDERQDRSNGWSSSSRQPDERQDRSNGWSSSSRQPDERHDRSNGWSPKPAHWSGGSSDRYDSRSANSSHNLKDTSNDRHGGWNEDKQPRPAGTGWNERNWSHSVGKDRSSEPSQAYRDQDSWNARSRDERPPIPRGGAGVLPSRPSTATRRSRTPLRRASHAESQDWRPEPSGAVPPWRR